MANSALLVMDVQRSIVDIAEADAAYLARLARAADAARSVGIPVIYVVIALRPGTPEVGPRNKVLNALVQDGLFAEGDSGTEIHPDVAPRPGDTVVTKRRASAFSGSDLDLVLRARGIDSLVLTGIATGAVVLATLSQAADLDFGLTVLSDGCLDPDPEVHRFLLEKLFPRQADVTTVDAWCRTLTP